MTMIKAINYETTGLKRKVLLALMTVALLPYAQAKTVYVATDGAAGNDGLASDRPLPTIDAALNIAATGDTVLVDEGTYYTATTIALSPGVTVLASKGPEKTIIEATGSPTDLVSVDGATFVGFAVTGASGKRAINILNDGTVSNCVVRNSSFTPSNDRVAVWVQSGTLTRSAITNNVISGSVFENTKGSAVRLTSGLIDSCIITHNSGSNSRASIKNYFFGGGVYIVNGTMRNSLVAKNYSQYNATGVYMVKGTIDGCTIVDNYNLDSTDTASVGLGLQGKNVGDCNVVNSIIWGNENKNGVANIANTGKSSSLTYLCTTPAVSGTGNVTDNPNFTDPGNDDYSIGFGGAVDCGTTRSWHEGALDLAGNPRVFNDVPDIGCYESQSTDLGCGFDVDETVGPKPFTVSVTGTCSAGTEGTTFKWYFTGDADPDVTKVGDASAGWTYSDIGTYDITLVVENGGATGSKTITGAVTVGPDVCYVDAANFGNSVEPYISSVTAATNIADALACAVKGTVIRVAAGTYPQSDTLTINGEVQVIGEGAGKVTVSTDSSATKALLSIANEKTVVSGMTFSGGGQSCIKLNGGTVSNCVIRDAKAQYRGGGAYLTGNSKLYGCKITANTVASVNVSAMGAGVYAEGADTVIENCEITDNESTGSAPNTQANVGGSGVWLSGGTMINCLVARNEDIAGAAVFLNDATMDNCTVVTNLTHATMPGGSANNWVEVGGVSACGSSKIRNSIVYDNSAVHWGAVTNFAVQGSAVAVSHSLVGEPGDAEPYAGTSNITYQDPQFRKPLNGDFRLRRLSPCRNAGDNAIVVNATDLLGNPRIFGKVVDMGCLENTSAGMIIYFK